MSEDSFSLDDFTGMARLFPLPNLVMFPHVVQPLHIFESRYIEMLEDALAGDHLIATALLMPGWEGEYDGRPPVDPIVCLGRVMSHSPTKEGRYNILLGGIARAQLTNELPAQRSFRQAEIEILSDLEPDKDDPELGALHAELVQRFRRFIPENTRVQKQLDDILTRQSQLGTLTDLISYSLPLKLAFRQALLAEVDVIQRTRLLLDQLRRETDSDNRQVPPEFSVN